jgi:hypothetical protein
MVESMFSPVRVLAAVAFFHDFFNWQIFIHFLVAVFFHSGFDKIFAASVSSLQVSW